MIDPESYLASVTSRPRSAQATPWQEAGADAAERMGEPKKTGAYAKIYKQNWVVRDKLDECVAWVERQAADGRVQNRGALFMSQHKKFIQPYRENT